MHAYLSNNPASNYKCIGLCLCFRKVLDLSQWQAETTHRVNCELDDGAGIIHYLLTITATMGNEAVSDLATYVPDPGAREEIVKKYVSVNL